MYRSSLARFSSPKGLAFILTLLAFLARVYHLPFESLDMDEADGVALASADFFTLAVRLVQPGENGPLYFILLRLWMAVAGQSEFSLRFLALMPGVLFIPASFALGRRLFGVQVALVVSLMATFSSYLLYYSQMNKMYSLLALLSIVSSYLFLQALSQGGRRWWGLYWASATLTMYTHVFGVMILPWHGLFFLLRIKEYKRRLTGWLLTTSLLSLPYLPLGAWHLSALGALGQLNRQFTGPHDLLGMLAVTAGEFGTRYQGFPPYLLGAVFIALGGLGLWRGLAEKDPGRRDGTLFLLLGVLAPLLITYLLVALGAPLFSSRYLMVSLPSFFLSWALGIRALRGQSRLWAVAVLALVLAFNLGWWAQSSLSERGVREDWRSAIRFVSIRYQEGDAMVLTHSNSLNPLEYYGGKAFSFVNLNTEKRGTNQPWEERLSQGAVGRRTLWLLTPYYELVDFPAMEPWLNANTYLADLEWFRGIRVSRYVPAPKGILEAKPSFSVKANFGNKLELLGYDLFLSQGGRGNPWLMRLYWRAKEAMDVEYWASVRLLDPSGRIWGRSEGPIAGGFYPSQNWRVGQVVPDEREMALTLGTPPGSYKLVVLAYKKETMENLLVIPLDESSPYQRLMGAVELTEPVSEGELSGRYFGANFGGRVELVAASLESATAKPGEKVHLTAYWKAKGPTREELSVKVQLIGPKDKVMGEVSSTLGTEAYPFGEWGTGQLVAQKLELPLSYRLPNGVYRVRLKLINPGGRAMSAKDDALARPKDYLDIGSAKVAGRERRFALLVALQPSPSLLGEFASLLSHRWEVNGVKVEPPFAVKRGDALRLTLSWQAVGETEGNYQVFVHMLDSGNMVRGQHDSFPMLGEAPTYGWVKGEVIEDPHPMVAAKDAPPGEYKIEVGFYDWKSGERLKTPEGQDRILLTALKVE